MPRANFKRFVPYVLCLSLVALICVIALPTVAQQSPVDRRAEIGRVTKELSERPSESLAKDALSERVTTLLKAKRDELRMRYETLVQIREQGVPNGPLESDLLTRAHAAWIDAELELTTIRADRLRLLRENVDSAALFEREIIGLRELGANGGSVANVNVVRAARFDAELRLARELIAQQN